MCYIKKVWISKIITFFASKKFAKAEINFENLEFAAKASIMNCFSLYGINFYTEALEGLNRYFKELSSG